MKASTLKLTKKIRISSSDVSEHIDLTKINDLVNVLNCSTVEGKILRGKHLTDLDQKGNGAQIYSNKCSHQMHTMISNEDEKIVSRRTDECIRDELKLWANTGCFLY